MTKLILVPGKHPCTCTRRKSPDGIAGAQRAGARGDGGCGRRGRGRTRRSIMWRGLIGWPWQHMIVPNGACLIAMQVVEEEFRHTAAGLGCTGAEANALTHQWTSPQGLGLHPPSSNPEALDDSAHSRARSSKGGQHSLPCTASLPPPGCTQRAHALGC